MPASLTVEAAVVLPLFLIAMLTLVSVIDICRIYTEQQSAVAEKAEKLAIYAYTAEEYVEDDYIDLFQVYPCQLAVSLIPGYRVNLTIRGRVYPWIGRSEEMCAADKDRVSQEMVYVTEHGSVYHTDASCNYLELSIYAVESGELSSARNNDGGRYNSCKLCGGTASVYYISPNGESFHTTLLCSGLTRKVQMVKKADVSHLPCCSKCQGG